MWDPYVEMQSVVLPNGLTIYCSYWPGRTFEIMEFLVHSGSNQDLDGKEGLAHFVEHLVSANGTKPHEEIHDFFRIYGDRVNFGRTNPMATTYGFCLPADRSVLEEALTLFGGCLLGAKLTAELEKQRAIILAEFRRAFPTQKGWQNFLEREALATRDGSLGKAMSILGTETTIASMTQHDLQAFYDAHYTPSNMSVVCSGGVAFDEIVALFTSGPFAQKLPGRRTPCPEPIANVGAYTVSRKEVSLADENPNAERIAGKFITRALVPGTVSSLAAGHLKGLLINRLNEELRERAHLVYHVRVEMLFLSRQYFELKIVCDGIDPSLLNQLEEIVETTILTLKDHEVVYAREKKTQQQGRIYFDPTVEGVAKKVIQDVIHLQRVQTRQEEWMEFDAVTFTDVIQIVPYITADKRFTKIVRP